jgi:outer membrane protein assembly factor BamB
VLRVSLRSLSALVMVAAAVLVGWRVLAPAEVLATVAPPYPAVRPDWPHVTGRTGVAPLIVDGKIRVYASKRQVRADAPIDAETVHTAIWSFRRWPEQLSGVVAASPTVISRWSDGELVAIDGRTGKIVWRADGPKAPGFGGHRTGADTVWGPPGLHLAEDAVLVTAGGRIEAYEVSTGARRWSTTATCADGFTTEGGQYVCSAGAYALATGSPVVSFPAGPYTPVGCDVAASNCTGLRDGAGHGWITDTVNPARAPTLDRPDSTVAAGVVFYRDAGGLRAADPVTGEVLHGYPSDSQVLGDADGRVVLLTGDRRLLTVSPRGGDETAFPLVFDTESRDWDPGRWQVTDGYVAIERLARDRPRDPDTPGYYFSYEPVIIAAL